MLSLQARAVSFRFDTQPDPLFTDVDLSLYAGEVAALLGNNGVGKTTLLHVLLGNLKPTAGELTPPARFKMLRQEETFTSSGNVLDALLTPTPKLAELHREITASERAGLPDPLRYADTVNTFAELGGYDLLQIFEAELDALEFTPNTLERPALSLSGGERRRLQLMSTFLNSPDLVVLDEPSNYLDESARDYLVRKIRSFAGACLLVSHDRWLLDEVATRVLELKHSRLTSYSGNYTTFRNTKDALHKEKTRTKERLESEISKLQAVERTYKIWGARKEKEKAGAADKGFIGARAARLNKRGILAKARISQRIETLKTAKPWLDKHYELSFEQADVPTGTCLSVRELGFGYGEGEVFSDLSLTLAWGERLALRGANGSGKSTVIKLLLGELEPQNGKLLWSKGSELGYLPQSWQTPDDVTKAADWFHDDEAQTARLMLGTLGVSGELFYTGFDALSEGQKRKTRLVRMLLNKPNVLILDEPSTHLDYESVELLEHALITFTGTLIVVTHDKYLRERLCNRELML